MAAIEEKLTETDPRSNQASLSKELISAVLDGETEHLSQDKIKFALEANDTRETWHRYQLIGEALRPAADDQSGAILGSTTAFADKLRDQIASEPTVLAPRKRTMPKYLQPVAGIALAASVAGLAVLGIQQMSAESSDQVQPLSVANLDAAEQVLGGSAVANNTEATDTPELEVDLAEHQRRLNSYLVNYNEQRTSLGMPGVNPYVRIVDFESEK
jgi:sigma-E factor negative regulatory protein RseA